jgi:gas vesicle protein
MLSKPSTNFLARILFGQHFPAELLSKAQSEFPLSKQLADLRGGTENARFNRKITSEKTNMNIREQRNLRSLGWLIAGIGIGTIAALLSAPYTGEEVRFALGRGYRRAAKRIGRRTEDVQERAKDLLENAQSFREDFGRQGRKLLRRWRAA